MFPSRTLTIPEFQRYMLLLGPQYLAAARRGLVKSKPQLLDAVYQSIQNTKGVAPSTRGMNMPAFATGRYKRSWRVDRPYRSGAQEISMRMLARSEYAGVIEYGRKPNSKMPPSSAIDRWLRAKGLAVGMAGPERRRYIFLIRRAIGKRGLQPGRRVLYNPTTQTRMILSVYYALLNEMNATLVRRGITP